MNFDFIKEHKVPFAVGALLLFGLLYYEMSKGSSAPASTSSGSASMNSMLAYQGQQAALAQQTNQQNAQLSVAQSQIDSQNQAQALAAGVQNNQVTAQYNATIATLTAQTAQAQLNDNASIQSIGLQTSAATSQAAIAAQDQLGIAQIDATNATAQNANQMNATIDMQQISANTLTAQLNAAAATTINGQNTQASVYTTQANDALAAANNSTNAQLDAYLSQNQVTNNANQLAAGVYNNTIAAQTQTQLAGITAATTLGTQAQQNQYNLSNTTLGIVQQAGIVHGTQNVENNITGITAAALNQPSIGTAAVSQYINPSSGSILASQAGGMFQSATKFAGNVIGGMFGL